MPRAVLPADDEPSWPSMTTAREGRGRERDVQKGERLLCEWG